MPSPIAFENASFAEKRVARNAMPRASERARRARKTRSSSGPSTFSANRPPVRSSTAAIRLTWTTSVPMP